MRKEVSELGEVLIGKKPAANYVTAIILHFNSGEKEVSVKARGKYIWRAVDIVERVRRKFLPNLKIKEIKISSEELQQENRKRFVSGIEIVLTV